MKYQLRRDERQAEIDHDCPSSLSRRASRQRMQRSHGLRRAVECAVVCILAAGQTREKYHASESGFVVVPWPRNKNRARMTTYM